MIINPLHSNISIHILHTILYVSLHAGKENWFNNQGLLKLVIISFVLMTVMRDSVLIM